MIDFVSDYLECKYHRTYITVLNGCCRQCLRGTPSVHDLRRTTFRELMKSGEIEPYQIANAFFTGSDFHSPCFKTPVINMSPEIACKFPGNCNLTCIVCQSLIVNHDEVEVDIWPGYKAHKNCTKPCIFPCCTKRIPTLPAYMGKSKFHCDKHGEKVVKVREVREVKVREVRDLKVRELKIHKVEGRISDFFQSPIQQIQIKPIQKETPRFIKRKDTGEIFGYWKGDSAFKLNDEPLHFKPKVYPKLDFKEPYSLSNPKPKDKSTPDEEQDKSNTSP
jgi:hypothetical protein